MATDEPNDAPASQPSGHEGTNSVRVAISVFLVTLLVLAGMAVYWLVIRF